MWVLRPAGFGQCAAGLAGLRACGRRTGPTLRPAAPGSMSARS
ncbi:hypothetical protein RAA17_00350 [Komagataeibacter rhaeticus]|nr:hypothetical protein [Komagataeibacter rhaeticus]